MDEKIKKQIINLLGEDLLEQLAISFLSEIGEANSTDEKKKYIINAFLPSYIENFVIMVVNHTDTDEHLAELLEEAEQNLDFNQKRNLLKKYVDNFENREKDLFYIYVDAYKKNYK